MIPIGFSCTRAIWDAHFYPEVVSEDVANADGSGVPFQRVRSLNHKYERQGREKTIFVNLHDEISKKAVHAIDAKELTHQNRQQISV